MEPVAALSPLPAEQSDVSTSQRPVPESGLTADGDTSSQPAITEDEEAALMSALTETAVSTIVMLMWSDIQRNQRFAEESMREVQK